MRILNAESSGYSPEARAVLAQVGEVVDADLDRPGLLDAVADVDVLIVRLRNSVDAEVLDAAPRLATIVTATTGLDHIDVAAATERGVEVLSLRGETDFLRTITATAEHTWALLLALVRNVPAAVDATRSTTSTSSWDRDRFRGNELAGKRLGIVGLGRIGSMVATYGRAFGMEVLANDTNVDPDGPDWPAGVVACASVQQLAARADVLTVHVPLDETTTGLIDRRTLEALPSAAVVINTSRGAVIDEDALCDLIESGHLGGVAADVVVGERGDGLGRLAALARRDHRVLITPHIGGATHESMEKTELFMADKLAAHLTASVGARR